MLFDFSTVVLNQINAYILNSCKDKWFTNVHILYIRVFYRAGSMMGCQTGSVAGSGIYNQCQHFLTSPLHQNSHTKS